MLYIYLLSLILALSFTSSWYFFYGFSYFENFEFFADLQVTKLKTTRDIPVFMWNIYKNGVNSSEIDVVRSVFPKAVGAHFKSGLYQNQKKREFQFVIPESTEHEKLIKAEVVIDAEKIKSCRISFQIYLKGDKWIFLDGKNVDDFESRWLSLQVTSGVKNVGAGLELLMVTFCRKTEKIIANDQVFLPLLVLSYFTESQKQNRSNNSAIVRIKRSLMVGDFEEKNNRIWKDEDFFYKFSKSQRRWTNNCRRRSLYIEFSEIDYDSWIVAPTGYEAFQCVGTCGFPFSESLSPTKHAILQTLLHNISPSKASRACCVPTRLEPISLLYVDENGVLTYRFRYHDMVVAECGCR